MSMRIVQIKETKKNKSCVTAKETIQRSSGLNEKKKNLMWHLIESTVSKGRQ